MSDHALRASDFSLSSPVASRTRRVYDGLMPTAIADLLRTALGPHDEILLAYLFGSVARSEHAEGSDVDVAVLSSNALSLDERGRLSEELGRALGFSRAVDVIDLREAS